MNEEKTLGRLTYLDGWRGLSILLVLVGHFFPAPGINLGLLGVEFFFVLSGRLMAEILFIKSYPLKTFFKRRFSRIYPALLAYVTISMVALSGTFIGFKWKAALTALTFTYNYAGIFKRAGALDHIWSLCVEEHAYILLALIAYLSARRGLSAMRTISVLVVVSLLDGVISYAIFEQYETTYWRTDVHIASILISALICMFKHRPDVPNFLRSQYFSVLCVISAIAAFADFVPLPLHYVIGTSLLALSVNFLDGANDRIKAALSSPPLVSLGLWSFSLYLWQQPFYKFVYHKEASPCLMLAGVFVCALISFYMVERPSRKWLNQNW